MASSSYVSNALQASIIAWDGMNITDFSAPFETFSNARNEKRERLYQVTIAAEVPTSGTTQMASINCHCGIDQICQEIDKYDVMVLPGGGACIVDMAPDVPGLKAVLKLSQILHREISNPGP